jgi:transposase
MATEASFLIPSSLHVTALLLGDDGVTIHALSEATEVHCPICGEPTERVHSRYTRTLADLPWARFAVHLHVEVRRFVCANPTCPRQMFAERLPGIAPACAHRTDGQRDRLPDIACALGGEEGARLAIKHGMPVSPDTLLQLLRAAPDRGRRLRRRGAGGRPRRRPGRRPLAPALEAFFLGKGSCLTAAAAALVAQAQEPAQERNDEVAPSLSEADGVYQGKRRHPQPGR